MTNDWTNGADRDMFDLSITYDTLEGIYRMSPNDKLWSMFIQDTGYHYLVRDAADDAIGIIWVPAFPEEIVIGVRVIGRLKATFELLKESQVGTYREMKLLPDLRYMNRQETTMKTMIGQTITCYQLNYVVSDKDYNPYSDEARTVTIPSGVVVVHGKVR